MQNIFASVQRNDLWDVLHYHYDMTVMFYCCQGFDMNVEYILYRDMILMKCVLQQACGTSGLKQCTRN